MQMNLPVSDAFQSFYHITYPKKYYLHCDQKKDSTCTL